MGVKPSSIAASSSAFNQPIPVKDQGNLQEIPCPEPLDVVLIKDTHKSLWWCAQVVKTDPNFLSVEHGDETIQNVANKDISTLIRRSDYHQGDRVFIWKSETNPKLRNETFVVARSYKNVHINTKIAVRYGKSLQKLQYWEAAEVALIDCVDDRMVSPDQTFEAVVEVKETRDEDKGSTESEAEEAKEKPRRPKKRRRTK